MKPIDGLLADLDSANWRTLAAKIESLDDMAQRGPLDSRDWDRICTLLEDLSLHEKWEVRLAVAGAMRLLPPKIFESVARHLQADANSWVVDKAIKVAAERHRAEREETVSDQIEAEIEREIAAIARGTNPIAIRRLLHRHAGIRIHEARHQLVNAVTALDMTFERLRSPSLSASKRPEFSKVSDEVAQSIDHLKLLVDALGSMGRPKPLKLLTHELGDLLRRAVDMAGGTNVEIRADGPTYFECDHLLILDSISNLIRNGIEASGEAAVRIEAEATDEQVTIRVVDQGRGMSPTTARTALKLFSTTKEHGIGLGLPVAKDAIEVHGGRLQLDSHPGEGTTATILLPRHPEFEGAR